MAGCRAAQLFAWAIVHARVWLAACVPACLASRVTTWSRASGLWCLHVVTCRARRVTTCHARHEVNVSRAYHLGTWLRGHLRAVQSPYPCAYLDSHTCRTEGGTGKSTLAAHLAVEWMRRGQSVLVVDVDPQGTTVTWWMRRAKVGTRTPPVVAIGDLRQALPELATGQDITTVHTLGRLGKQLVGALVASDLALFPCKPTPTDVWALAESVETPRRPPGRRHRGELLLGRVAMEALLEAGLPVMESVICQRDALLTKP